MFTKRITHLFRQMEGKPFVFSDLRNDEPITAKGWNWIKAAGKVRYMTASGEQNVSLPKTPRAYDRSAMNKIVSEIFLKSFQNRFIHIHMQFIPFIEEHLNSENFTDFFRDDVLPMMTSKHLSEEPSTKIKSENAKFDNLVASQISPETRAEENRRLDRYAKKQQALFIGKSAATSSKTAKTSQGHVEVKSFFDSLTPMGDNDLQRESGYDIDDDNDDIEDDGEDLFDFGATLSKRPRRDSDDHMFSRFSEEYSFPPKMESPPPPVIRLAPMSVAVAPKIVDAKTQTSGLSVTFDERSFTKGRRRIVSLKLSDEGQLVVEQNESMFTSVSDVSEMLTQVVVFEDGKARIDDIPALTTVVNDLHRVKALHNRQLKILGSIPEKIQKTLDKAKQQRAEAHIREREEREARERAEAEERARAERERQRQLSALFESEELDINNDEE